MSKGRDTSSVSLALNDGIPPARGLRPACVIDWSNHLARAEADLRLAMLVTVVSLSAGPAMDDLEATKAMVASSFNLARDNLVLRRCHIENVYILLVEDEATVSRLVHADPISGPGEIRLLCRHWTRQAFAEGGLAFVGECRVQRNPCPCMGDVHSRELVESVWLASTYSLIHKKQGIILIVSSICVVLQSKRCYSSP